MIKICYFIFCIVVVGHVHGRVAVFDHYGTKQGLNNEPITAIVESENGFIWVGTPSGVMKFDGISFEKISTDSITPVIHVQSLWVDDNDALWIGTRKNGLLLYSDQVLTQVNHVNDKTYSITEIIQDAQKRLWVSANNGLFLVEQKFLVEPAFNSLTVLYNKKIDALTSIDKKLIIGVNNGFYLLDTDKDSIQYISFKDENQLRIHDLHVDRLGVLWIATSKKSLRFDMISEQFLKVPVLKKASRILSIAEDKKNMWLATIEGGVFSIDLETLSVSQYTYENDFEHSLREKNMTSLYISDNGFLWAGGFSQGLSVLDLKLQSFGFETNIKSSVYCAKNENIKSIELDADGYLWLGSNYGLTKYNANECHNILLGLSNDEYTVYSTRNDGGGVWISSSVGLLYYDKKTQKTFNFGENRATFFSHELSKEKLLVGTSFGLFEFSKETRQFALLTAPEQKYQEISYLKYTVKGDKIYLPTFNGLLYLNHKGKLKKFEHANQLFVDSYIHDVQFDMNDDMFISVRNKGLYHLDRNYNIIKHYFDGDHFSSANSIRNILTDDVGGKIWLASFRGLMVLDKNTEKHHLFSGSSNSKYLSLINGSFKDELGNLYFTGIHGLVAFNPNDIVLGKRNTSVVLSDLFLMNNQVNIHQKTTTGFMLNKPLSEIKHLNFSHKDKVIKFDFVALNFNNPQKTRYQYQLVPTSTDWIELPSGNHQLIFSDLKSGDYQLKLKSTNADQLWSDDMTKLGFTVRPAPWFSWQAYVLYVLCILAFIVLYISQKIKKQQQINHYLNVQIDKKTKHIQEQKELVENLMTRKNEIFSNVSHEFRTPITLILGPMTELQKTEKDPDKVQAFEMMNRNAQRLLRLVNQMLKLAHITENTPQKKEVVNVSSRLTMITEPYTHEAKKRKISLCVKRIPESTIFVTEDALESTVGNFLSNAIKYAADHGKVTVGTQLHADSIEVYVRDNGSGISEMQKASIFKRFNRMPHHKSHEGLGIGLALAKEVADLNGAGIHLESELNQGSTFSIIFPLHKEEVVDSEKKSITSNEQEVRVLDKDKEKQTVLIIDDNEDMLNYINSVLMDNYHCLLANNGKNGIAIAIKYVPDIIICDVMMPGIDGFQVCRRLRSEMITSHIPLVLLTAVDEKASRIKGWRENIDMYLNKPFDAHELNLQLRNILNIRVLIQNSIKNNPHEVTNSKVLSEVDQRFIKQLTNINEKGFADFDFGVDKMSAALFITPRQLQRKTRALLNVSPVTFLREFRLKKAANLLKNGYQVSLIADTCGFSSISYLSQSFKSHYGLTPKEYQKIHNDPDPIKNQQK